MSLSENLITAAKNGNTKEVRKLLGKGALFTKDQFGNTALHEAAWNGNNDIVKILLTGFCFVDSINNTGFTPLHLASQNGHAKVVKTLLKWKANPTLLNQHGETALHLVAKYDHANVVSSFAAHKVWMDLRGKDGNTALHIAATLGNMETAKAMISAGAHPALPNDRSLRPVDCAEAGGYSALVKLLSSAMQKYKPKNRNTSVIVSPTEMNPRSPYTIGHSYSLSQPDDYAYVHEDPSPVHAIKSRSQRSMSVSGKLKASKDARSPGIKRKNKKGNLEKEDKFTGSLSPTPHKYFSSQDELDKPGLCVMNTVRSASPAFPKQATIDQLLTEIETEYLGPGYKYKPLHEPQYGDNKENHDYSHPRPVHSSKSQLPDNEYDYPTNSNSNSNSNNLQIYDQVRVPSEHAHYQTPRQARKLPSPPASKKGEFKHHTYEPLLPKEDKDTYVYMAPLSDYPELLQQEVKQQTRGSLSPRTSDSQSLLSESGSEVSTGGSSGGGRSTKKVAAVRDSPIEADRKYEPNTLLEPVKGILISQTANNEGDKSQLEDYLQSELETIRQAFQIRLNQLEKRYQRQLELEKQKRVISPLTSQQAMPTSPQSRELAKQRRNSWHSCMSPIEQDKNESVLNIELPSGSDFYEHDPSLVNELPESLREDSTNEQQNECTCNRSTEDEFSDYEDMSGCVVDKSSQELIQQKVSEHRERMMQHFKEKSEARIAAIEQKYLSQINEMQRKHQDAVSSDNVTQGHSTTRDIEDKVEVQTLV